MKILFLANAASIHTVRWVNALSERGHEVHLVYKFDDEPKENKISNKVLLHRLKYSGTKGYLLNARELRILSNSIKFDVINAHYASGYGILARIANLRPLVLSVWGSDVYDFPYQSKLKMKMIVDNLRYADQIASTSNSMANQVRKLLKETEKKIEITPFGIDIEQFSRIDRFNNEDLIIIGNIKILSPKYGIDDFIKSIKILKENLNNNGNMESSKKIRVKIYGDGEQKNELQDLIETLDLGKTIKLEGKIPNTEVPLALNEFDIFCSTSVLDSESFGVAIVEAMSMDLPVVATDVSGFKEVVDNGKTGIIVERNNPLAIAKALEKLVLDGALRSEYGENGRKKVEMLYNWKDNVNKMIDIYKSV